MDAIQFLQRQHEQAKRALAQIGAAAASERRQLWRKLRPELETHERLEETYVYGPVAREAGGGDGSLRSWEQRHREEVQEAEAMIARLDGGEPSEERWLGDLRRLEAALEKHIDEEERQIWPQIGRVWDAERLERAGTDMERQAGERAA
jgi:hemerythrin-like domain-containing protein